MALRGRWLVAVVLVLVCFQVPSEADPGRSRPCRDGLTRHDHLAFARSAQGASDIWTVQGDGRGLRRLTSSGQDYQPAISPTGALIAFESRRDGNAELYLVRSDGTGLRRLTRTPMLREVRAAWHPDGRHIAFHSFPRDDTSLDNQELELLDVVTGSRRRLTSTPGAKEVKPAWSPDGKQIAFEAGEPAAAGAAPNDDIWVLRLADGRRTRLTDQPGREWFPAWSPDGRQIAFMSAPGGTFDLWVMRADGSGQQQITSAPTYDAEPTWAPDGSRIVYAEDDAVVVAPPGVYFGPQSSSSELVSVRPDGSGRHVITSGAIDASPSYQPCRQRPGKARSRLR
jgi:Tol biopolymer transport system component